MPENNAINDSPTFDVPSGGTGATTLTDHGVLVGSGVSAITALTVGSAGELLVGASGADPAFGTSADGDFTFTSSTASVDRTLTVSNTDNTVAATSAANLQLTVGGGNVGDPRTTYTVSGVQSFTTGIDNDADDSFKIAASTALGTTDTFIMTTAGELTMPLQPAFSAQPSGTLSNITGDGTAYTVVLASEDFDQGSNFASNTFTAPVTGKYYLIGAVGMGGITSSHTDGILEIVTTARTYGSQKFDYASMDFGGNMNVVMAVLADMTASDTATLRLTVDNGTKVVDLFAGNTFFQGFLAC